MISQSSIHEAYVDCTKNPETSETDSNCSPRPPSEALEGSAMLTLPELGADQTRTDGLEAQRAMISKFEALKRENAALNYCFSRQRR